MLCHDLLWNATFDKSFNINRKNVFFIKSYTHISIAHKKRKIISLQFTCSCGNIFKVFMRGFLVLYYKINVKRRVTITFN